MNLQVDQAALLELIEASEWYEDARAGLGSEFLAAVQQAFEQIATAPRAHPLLEYWNSTWEVRRLSLRRFPYLVVYWIHNEIVTVVAIAHARRRPLYWIDRIPPAE